MLKRGLPMLFIPVVILVIIILSGSFYFLEYFHVLVGSTWTGMDLVMGVFFSYIMAGLDPRQKSEIAVRLTPTMLFFMPSIAASTITAGIYLAYALHFSFYNVYFIAVAVLVLILFIRKPDYTIQSRTANARKRMEPLFVLSRISSSFMDHVIVDESVSASPVLRASLGYRPGSYFTSRTGQLGWALPSAAGMATAIPNVLCITGDGSFMYTPQTLWTIKRYNLPVKLIILNNGGYMILRSYSSSYYEDLRDADFFRPEIDLVKLVESFGLECMVADSEISEINWLREGSEPKVLIVNVSKEVPKLFM